MLIGRIPRIARAHEGVKRLVLIVLRMRRRGRDSRPWLRPRGKFPREVLKYLSIVASEGYIVPVYRWAIATSHARRAKRCPANMVQIAAAAAIGMTCLYLFRTIAKMPHTHLRWQRFGLLFTTETLVAYLYGSATCLVVEKRISNELVDITGAAPVICPSLPVFLAAAVVLSVDDGFSGA
jgi:hypothetical protein